MPSISVIMNVRNGEQFLREALDSVLAQTFTDWELIVWDDCSTDDSAMIVKQYHDPRIQYFLSPDETPLGEARNQAIRQGTGDWLAFLDQDDIWLPRKLEEQVALIAGHVGIIYGRTVLFDSQRGDLRDYDYAHEFEPLPHGDIFARLFREGCFIAMSSAVLRRSAVAEVGRIPDSIQVIPDYYLYAAIARHYQARAVQQVVCRYRVHAGSMSASRRHRLRLFQEPLWIIDLWAADLDPQLLAYRRMSRSTSLAVEEMRSRNTVLSGLRRLFSDGSVVWLMSRPFQWAWRATRRHLQQPYWRKSQAGNLNHG
jgi:glycosyltransferase involved in cell wall biosynthesis